MSHAYSQYLINEQATLLAGKALAIVNRSNAITIYLNGDLGAGKTTLVRGFLQGLGYMGHVKSPTYTLVESYPILATNLYHFDLYRLSATAELDGLGLRDYFAEPAIMFIEWPERGEGILPTPDLHCRIKPQSTGRLITWQASSDLGSACLAKLVKRK